MGTISKIRKRSGLLLIAIGGAMVLFVMSDLFFKNKRPTIPPLAKVFDENITYNEFLSRYESTKEQYKMQYGEDMTFSGAEEFQIKNSVFDQLIKNILIQIEYEKTGLKLTDAEIYEYITGQLTHPIVKQLFTNPQTGEFNQTLVYNFINNLEQRPEREQKIWKMYEKIIIDELFTNKYINLITKSFYFPKRFAEKENKERTVKKKVVYVALHYGSLKDSAIQVTDKDFEKYYAENKYLYTYEEELTDIDYVIFHIKPSQIDMRMTKTKVDTTFTSFINTPIEKLPEFIVRNSDLDYTWDSSYLAKEELSYYQDTLFNAKIGSYVKPYLEGFSFFMHRLIDRKELPDSMKAAHILVSYQGAMFAQDTITRTKEQAKARADSILNLVKGKDSSTFAKIAKEMSNDPSAQQNNGFLGWFKEGTMVPEFNNACLHAKPGEFMVVETPYGFHVIKLLAKSKPTPKVKIATVKISVPVSKQTTDSIYNLASVIAAETKNYEDFEKILSEKGYIKNVAEKVRKTDYTIAGLENGREIIRWSFYKETKPRETVNLFDLSTENKYVVAIVKNKYESGPAPLEQIKDLIKPMVIKEKKAEMLEKELKTKMEGCKSVFDLASKLKENPDTFDINFFTYSLPGYGPESKLIGKMYATTKGKLVGPVKGEGGVYAYEIIDETKPDSLKYDDFFKQKFYHYQSKVNGQLFKALQKLGNLKDNRIEYY
ncbi:MAG: SurA N-terminal domain-containing protein [Bacteroidales bacterium]|nr:SurA N-terminal domain-containing protein [Bacteroidales bacterium]